MRLFRLCWMLAIATLLAGCAGVPTKHVFPPRASIQQLTVQPDGTWKLQIRMQNYSDVSMTFTRVEARIDLAGSPAGTVSVSPALRIGPDSADIAETSLRPSPAAAHAVEAMHGSVRYKLNGRIVTTDPSRDLPYEFDGVLSPVPGLPGVLR